MKNLLLFLFLCAGTVLANPVSIRISTAETDLVLKTGANGRLFQHYFGVRLNDASEYDNMPLRSSTNGQSWEVYPVAGSDSYFEPAFGLRHNDGNLTSILEYVTHSQQQIDGNVTKTVITLKDKLYPVEVKLFYMTFHNENIIKSWSEISHREKKPVSISRYASSLLYLREGSYHLTEFSGDWAKEVGESTQQLSFGKKIVDSRLGARANMFASPFFIVGLNQTPRENDGTVLMGTLNWTGNFRFVFEVDNLDNLRVVSGINPDASQYELMPGDVFTTPEFVFTLSNGGRGKGSRDLHRWARKYQLKDGDGDRMTLLNNWEATYFTFDEPKLSSLMKEAKELGVDLFLLDDGWFGNKYPRHSDTQGLGDWEATAGKLPNGVPYLVDAAHKAGVKFGIWIEPEMVNPKSELYEKHPDWVIELPGRQTYYFRNQLVLDLTNPKVQDHVFSVVDKLMTANPDIAYFKWDCNSPITNIYSPYLKDKQGNLYVDYVNGLYKVLDRIKSKYPNLPMMLCSGGGGRSDYKALQYFTEFWCSDNTDPIERIYIQWGYSQFFPAKAMAAHVTSWNSSASIKFRTDVAMMCKLGFDINIKELNSGEQQFCRDAVANFNRLKPVVLDGDQYRLVSPYEGNHAAVIYVDEAKDKAVVYAYDIFPRFAENITAVKLQGLDANKKYRVKEINLMPDRKSSLPFNDKVFSGDFLMKAGINLFSTGKLSSRVVELEVVR
jgi:alpha-galactosidase